MMQKKFGWLLLLPMLFMLSCTNLDDINSRLDDHDKRLKNLESLVTNANTSIDNLQKLVTALEKKVSIVEYTPLEDGSGYSLKMSDGSTITLKNGMNGTSPVVGVKDINGTLYWTINGEVMNDAYGEPIKAEGQDGQDGLDGKTPQIRVNTDGYWEVSIDGGYTFQLVKDSEGNPVKAKGSDATVDLKITEDETAIVIIFHGQKFIIPKGETPDYEADRPTLAIEYMAEYNINETGSAFETTHANNSKALFTYDDAKKMFMGEKPFAVDGKEYHMPSHEEWRGIIPDFNGGKNVRFNGFSNDITKDYAEKIEIAGETKEYTADYMPVNKTTTCALRFKDNEENTHRSAYRYELIDNPASQGGKLLKITVKYVGKNMHIELSDIAKDEYWKDTENAVVRYLPASGYARDNEVYNEGTYGRFWSSESPDENRVFCTIFNANIASSDMKYYGTDKSSIRLFVTKK